MKAARIMYHILAGGIWVYIKVLVSLKVGKKHFKSDSEYTKLQHIRRAQV